MSGVPEVKNIPGVEPNAYVKAAFSVNVIAGQFIIWILLYEDVSFSNIDRQYARMLI